MPQKPSVWKWARSSESAYACEPISIKAKTKNTAAISRRRFLFRKMSRRKRFMTVDSKLRTISLRCQPTHLTSCFTEQEIKRFELRHRRSKHTCDLYKVRHEIAVLHLSDFWVRCSKYSRRMQGRHRPLGMFGLDPLPTLFGHAKFLT